MTEPVWQVHATGRFKRDVHRLPTRIATAVVEYVTSVLPGNPLRQSKALTGELTGLRSARRGDYRVIFEVDETAHAIVLLRVAHRSHAYRRG